MRVDPSAEKESCCVSRQQQVFVCLYVPVCLLWSRYVLEFNTEILVPFSYTGRHSRTAPCFVLVSSWYFHNILMLTIARGTTLSSVSHGVFVTKKEENHSVILLIIFSSCDIAQFSPLFISVSDD